MPAAIALAEGLLRRWELGQATSDTELLQQRPDLLPELQEELDNARRLRRAALAARQGRQLTPDDLRAERNLRPLLAGSGWDMTAYVDEDARFLALARAS